MATIVTHPQQVGPNWAEQLAANVLGSLATNAINRMYQSMDNRKRNTLFGQTLTDALGQGTGGSQVTGQFGGQTGAGGGWEGAFHGLDNSLANFDAAMGTGGTTGQGQTQPITPITQVQNRMPTTVDFMRALAANMANPRWSHLNFEDAMKGFANYLQAYDTQRMRDLQGQYADNIRTAQNWDDYIRMMQAANMQGVADNAAVSNAIGYAQFRQPHHQPYTQNTGPTTRYGSFDPATGEFIPAGEYQNGLTPEQAKQHEEWRATFEAQQAAAQRDFDLRRERQNFDMQPKYVGVQTGDDGRLYIIKSDGSREPFNPNSVTLSNIDQQRIALLQKTNEDLTTELGRLGAYRDSLIKNGVAADSEEVKAIDNRIKDIIAHKKRNTEESDAIWSRAMQGQQGQGSTTRTTSNSELDRQRIEQLNRDEARITSEIDNWQDKYNNAANDQERMTALNKIKSLENELAQVRATRNAILSGNGSDTTTTSGTNNSTSLANMMIGGKGKIPKNGEFGAIRKNPDGSTRNHKGVDFAVAAGTPITVLENMGENLKVIKVVKDQWGGGYGHYVVLEGTRGGHKVRYLMGHMQAGSIRVKEGDIVRPGTVIGGVGSTGNSSGNHLHFEVRVDDQLVDPEKFLATYPLSQQGAGTQDNPRIIQPSTSDSEIVFTPTDPVSNGSKYGWGSGSSSVLDEFDANTSGIVLPSTQVTTQVQDDSPIIWESSNGGKAITRNVYNKMIADAIGAGGSEAEVREKLAQNGYVMKGGISSQGEPYVLFNPKTGAGLTGATYESFVKQAENGMLYDMGLYSRADVDRYFEQTAGLVKIPTKGQPTITQNTNGDDSPIMQPTQPTQTAQTPPSIDWRPSYQRTYVTQPTPVKSTDEQKKVDELNGVRTAGTSGGGTDADATDTSPVITQENNPEKYPASDLVSAINGGTKADEQLQLSSLNGEDSSMVLASDTAGGSSLMGRYPNLIETLRRVASETPNPQDIQRQIPQPNAQNVQPFYRFPMIPPIGTAPDTPYMNLPDERYDGDPVDRAIPIPNHDPNEEPQMELAANRRGRRRRAARRGNVTRTSYDQLRSTVDSTAERHGVESELIQAIIQTESTWNPNAVSPSGARGLMQLMPATARSLGVRDSFDPAQNIEGGTKYFASLLRKYGGNITKALWAYNCGPGNVKRGRVPKRTRAYAQKVLNIYNKLKGNR